MVTHKIWHKLSGYFLHKALLHLTSLTLAGSLLTACKSMPQLSSSSSLSEGAAITLPFLKNSPNECYYLDDFMPVPNNMVTGKSAAINLRYYTYNAATYKDWQEKQIILSFYSNDGRCWSLFEEYFVSP